jgi:hypothetical protein
LKSTRPPWTDGAYGATLLRRRLPSIDIATKASIDQSRSEILAAHRRQY